MGRWRRQTSVRVKSAVVRVSFLVAGRENLAMRCPGRSVAFTPSDLLAGVGGGIDLAAGREIGY